MSSPLKKHYRTNRAQIIPNPNPDNYGKNWKWDERKYRVAEMLADGYSAKHISEEVGIHHSTINNWLRVPDYCDYVDSLIFETGVAVKRDRIARLKRMAESLDEFFFKRLEAVMLSPETSEEKIRDISSEIRELLKQIAKEKEEYVEVNKTHVTGEVSNKVSIENVEKFLQSLGDETRDKMREEFNAIADKVVQSVLNGAPLEGEQSGA